MARKYTISKGLKALKWLPLFFLIWGVMGLFINNRNSHFFGLQNAGIEALIERGTLYLEGSTLPEFVPSGDTFRFNGHSYAMKQPGQFLIGSLIYWPLNKLNIRFVNHYDYASNVITWLTSGVVIAAIAALLYIISGSYLASIILAFGTIAWPYAGVSHHDIYAMGVGFMAVYFAYRKKYLWAGIMAGITLFFSMLPMTLPVSLGLAIIVYSKKKQVIWKYIIGIIIGITPSLFYNSLVFGHPLLFPNLAGHVSDTLPIWNLSNMVNKIWFYLGNPTTALWAFSPILVFAFVGWAKLNKASKFLGYAVVFIPLLQLIHITTQETFGGYQYGPRYLLPILPLLSLTASYGWGAGGSLGKKIFLLLLSYSVGVGIIGALTTVMYPQPGPYAPFFQFKEILTGNMPEFRMWPVGVVIMGIGLVTWYYQRARLRT